MSPETSNQPFTILGASTARKLKLALLFIKDSYGRYLKSPVFKETQRKAVAPEPHRFRLAIKRKVWGKILSFWKSSDACNGTVGTQSLSELKCHNTHNILFPLSETQLEQNAKKRRPSLSPIILRQQEEEQKAKLAASGPVDITQVMSKLAQKKGTEYKS